MKKYGGGIGIVAALVLILGALPYCGSSPVSPPDPLGGKVTPLPELILTSNPDSFSLITARYNEDIYVMATLQIGKKVWKKVRLRVRGDTSRSFPKKSLKLKLPKGKDLPFDRADINLNAEYLDRTYMRQYLATRVFQDSGQPCYKTQHVKVRLNGAYLGLFLLVQNVDKDFLEQWGMNKKGDLFKATRDHACLNRQSEILEYWERKGPKGDSTWTPLEELIHLLNETPDADYMRMVHTHLNYKNMVNSIAVNLLLGNRSTYYHNYFMYRSPDKHQWRYLPWDMDKTFIQAELPDEYHRGNLADSYNATMESNPFFERALVIPQIFNDIQHRIDTLVATVFNPAHLYPILDSLERVLAPEIPSDTFYQAQPLEGWRQAILQIKLYIEQRPLMLYNQFTNNPTSFQLIQPSAPLAPSGYLYWHPAHDPNDDPLTYKICFCPDPKFPAAKTNCYPELKDTAFALPPELPPGKYYWKVSATDGLSETRGFDNVTTVEIRKN